MKAQNFKIIYRPYMQTLRGTAVTKPQPPAIFVPTPVGHIFTDWRRLEKKIQPI